MVLDSLINYKAYINLHPLFKHAFEYLGQTDFNALLPGKHAIQGDDLFVICQEYETKDVATCLMENHRKYIDIQYMVSGEEMMGIAVYNNQVPVRPYEEDKEAELYPNECDAMIKVKQGQFTIFFPHDLHMPCLKSGSIAKVKKAVLKIKIASLL